MDLKAINSEIGLENEGDMDLQGARTFFLRAMSFILAGHQNSEGQSYKTHHFVNSLAVPWLRLSASTAKVGVQALVRELGSHKLCSVAKNKNKKTEQKTLKLSVPFQTCQIRIHRYSIIYLISAVRLWASSDGSGSEQGSAGCENQLVQVERADPAPWIRSWH